MMGLFEGEDCVILAGFIQSEYPMWQISSLFYMWPKMKISEKETKNNAQKLMDSVRWSTNSIQWKGLAEQVSFLVWS